MKNKLILSCLYSLIIVIILASIVSANQGLATSGLNRMWCDDINIGCSFNGMDYLGNTELNLDNLKLEKLSNQTCFNYKDGIENRSACFTTNLPSTFYYNNMDNGLKFSWNVNPEDVGDATNFTIYSTIPWGDLGNRIDFSDFTNAGLNYAVDGNELTIINPEQTNWWFDPIWIYQENATSITYTGGWINPGNVFDNNWATYGRANTATHAYMYFNYSRIMGEKNSSLWRYKDGGASHAFENLSILDSCWNYDNDTLQLSVQSHESGSSSEIYWYCYDGSWEELRDSLHTNNPYVYEEAMFWDVNVLNLTMNPSDGYNFFINQNINLNCSVSIAYNQTGISLTNLSLYLDGVKNETINPITCYQESANTTNQTGIDGNCGLNYSGSNTIGGQWYQPFSAMKFYDGNWGTYGVAQGFAYLYITYIKPVGAIGAIWQVKDLSGYKNLSFLNYPDCWNANTSKVDLRVYVTLNTDWQCYNGTDWRDMTIDGGGTVYEEAMWWNISPLNNLSISKNLSFNNSGLHNFTCDAYDNFNNYINNTNEFNINVATINNINYNPITQSGNIETFTANITSLSDITNAIFTYNDTNYTPTIYLNGSNYIISSTIYIPIVNSISNKSFYFTIITNNGNQISNIYNQTINPVSLSTNCSGNYPFMNISNFDEINLNQMNGTVEYNVKLINSNSQIGQIYGNTSGKNISICSNINLSGSTIISNIQLRYYAYNYMYKTYNIPDGLASSIPFIIPLYYLNNTIGTSFIINYVDFNYLQHPGAIIQIQRQYLSDDTFKIVEIPKISDSGSSQGSFDTHNVRYKIIVIEGGVTIDTFNNVFPACQNIVLGTCNLNLRGTEHKTPVIISDFSYTLNQTSNSIELTYTIPSGTPKTVTFHTNQNSRFLNNISTCNTTIFASGGTIICGYNNTVGDSLIDLQIAVSGQNTLYGQIGVSENLSSFFLLNNYVIAFLMLLTIILMFISSAAVMLIVAVIGLIYLGIVFLLNGVSVYLVGLAITWLIVAIGLAIFKISQKEERT